MKSRRGHLAAAPQRPHLSARGRERRGEALAGRLSGPAWAERGSWAVGVRLVGFVFFFFSFSNLFKPNSNLLISNLFHLFKLKILTQICSNILRLLENFFKHFKIQTFNLFFF
jgi:hypothetical protein